METRSLAPELKRYLAEENKMCFIAGPRQVGKTTLSRALLQDAKGQSVYLNWDVDSDRKLITRSPDEFWQHKVADTARSQRGKVRLALDEIHKFPRWKRFLKGLYDGHKDKLEILVTGSGRLDVYQRGGDSLFGRYHMYNLHPFTVGELISSNRTLPPTPEKFFESIYASNTPSGAEEGLEQIETFTGFPEPLFASSHTRLNRWRRSHEQLILREDLRDLTRIRELGLVESLVMLLPERVGSSLSMNALREDLGVRYETVQNWIEALARLYFLFTVRPYAARLARSLRREEKVYLYDFTSIPTDGARFENVVALHLRKLVDLWNDIGYGDFALHYVRDREKREVDFLISDSNKPYALIETKLAARDVDSSLVYFTERLQPRYSIQITRKPPVQNASIFSKGILRTSAAHFLGRI